MYCAYHRAIVEFGTGTRDMVDGLPAFSERFRGHHPVRSVPAAADVTLAVLLDHDLHLGEADEHLDAEELVATRPFERL